jgi:hypothetical protein
MAAVCPHDLTLLRGGLLPSLCPTVWSPDYDRLLVSFFNVFIPGWRALAEDSPTSMADLISALVATRSYSSTLWHAVLVQYFRRHRNRPGQISDRYLDVHVSL